jgi:nonsense-mediated mRNA decay protein 3
MVKPRNKGNHLTKKHKKGPSKKNFQGGGGGSSKKRKREDSPDAISLSKQKRRNLSEQKQHLVSVDPEGHESVVYIRQRVAHRRLLLYAEQLLMRHNFGLHKDLVPPTVQVSSQQNELIIYFSGAAQAKKCVNLLTSLLPVNSSTIDTVSSSNVQEQREFNVEIAPICTGDLVVLPPRLYTSMGQFGPLVLCWKLDENLSFINPENLQVGEITAYHYFSNKNGQKPFKALMNSKNLNEYTVVDVEKVMKINKNNERVPVKNGKFELAEVSVCKSTEIGLTDSIVQVKTHLGAILQPGDKVLGYDLKSANMNNEYLESSSYKHLVLPDVVLVRKVYEKPKRRYWLLKPGAVHGSTADQDYDQLLDELEEDEEMRKKINLYKDPNYMRHMQQDMKQDREGGNIEIEEAWQKVPHVRLEELLDHLAL